MSILLRPESELRLFLLLFLIAAFALLGLYAATAPGGDDALGDVSSAFRTFAGLSRSF